MQIEETVLYKTSDEPFNWKFLVNNSQIFLEEDEIHCEFIPSFEGSVEAYADHYSLKVIRKREMTEVEKEEKLQKESESMKLIRYEKYLKLKKEFEND